MFKLSIKFTFIPLEHIFVRLGIFLLLRVVGRQQTRYEAGHGASASRLTSREGGRPADYRSDPVRRGASSHSSGSFSPLGSTIHRRLCPELGMHLADTGSPVACFRAGLDNPRGPLKTRPEGVGGLGVSAELSNDARDVYIYLRDGYINAICPLSPALCVCVPQPTVASLGVLYPPSGPSFEIGSQPAPAALCVTMRVEDPHSHTHTPDESPKRGVGAMRPLPSSNRRRLQATEYPESGFLFQAVSVVSHRSSQRASPAVMAASSRGFVVSACV